MKSGSGQESRTWYQNAGSERRFWQVSLGKQFLNIHPVDKNRDSKTASQNPEDRTHDKQTHRRQNIKETPQVKEITAVRGGTGAA